MISTSLPNTINTVTGALDAKDMGVTLSHEHLLLDASIWYEKPNDRELQKIADAPITLPILGTLRRAGHFSRTNQKITNVPLAAEELSYFKRQGGSTIFDCTC